MRNLRYFSGESKAFIRMLQGQLWRRHQQKQWERIHINELWRDNEKEKPRIKGKNWKKSVSNFLFQTISFHKLHTKTTGSVPGSSVVSGNNLDKQFPTSRSYIQCGFNVFFTYCKYAQNSMHLWAYRAYLSYTYKNTKAARYCILCYNANNDKHKILSILQPYKNCKYCTTYTIK